MLLFFFFSKKQKKEEGARMTEATPVMWREPTHPGEASRCRLAATHPPGGGCPVDSPFHFVVGSRRQISEALTRASLKPLLLCRRSLTPPRCRLTRQRRQSESGGGGWGVQSCSNLCKPFAATKKILFSTAVTSPISRRITFARAEETTASVGPLFPTPTSFSITMSQGHSGGCLCSEW